MRLSEKPGDRLDLDLQKFKLLDSDTLADSASQAPSADRWLGPDSRSTSARLLDLDFGTTRRGFRFGALN
jgi:hypothetical protein